MVEKLARLIQWGMHQGVLSPQEPILAAAAVLCLVNMAHILFLSSNGAETALRDRNVEQVLFAAMGY